MDLSLVEESSTFVKVEGEIPTTNRRDRQPFIQTFEIRQKVNIEYRVKVAVQAELFVFSRSI